MTSIHLRHFNDVTSMTTSRRRHFGGDEALVRDSRPSICLLFRQRPCKLLFTAMPPVPLPELLFRSARAAFIVYRDELQDVERPKPMVPPSTPQTAQTTGIIVPFLGRGVWHLMIRVFLSVLTKHIR